MYQGTRDWKEQQILDDEEIARRLQQEEMANIGLAPLLENNALFHHPFNNDSNGIHNNTNADSNNVLNDINSINNDNGHNGNVHNNNNSINNNNNIDENNNDNNNRNQQVHRNLVEDMHRTRESSGRLLILYIIYAIVEMLASTVIASIAWKEECDRPLQYWIVLFSARFLVLVPLEINKHNRLRENEIPSLRHQKLKMWANFLFLGFFVQGNFWVYGSETCQETSPTLFVYSVILITAVYISMTLPVILLAALCLCLPCVFVVLRLISTQPGAPEEVIQDLPTRIFGEGPNDPQPAGNDDNDDSGTAQGDDSSPPLSPLPEIDSAPCCSICMEDYEHGDELRVLPCRHEYHVSCVDQWLTIRSTCPLCRGNIIDGSVEEEEEQDTAHNSSIAGLDADTGSTTPTRVDIILAQ